MANNFEQVNFTDPGEVTGLTSAKGDIITGDASSGLTSTTVGANDTILTADSTAPGGVKWASAPVDSDLTYNSAYITADRSFPTIGDEGVSTLGALSAKKMWITLWGGGGGGAGFSTGTDASGGGSGGVVNRYQFNPNNATLSGETITCTIGPGGAGGVNTFEGDDGTETTTVSTDGGTVIDLTAYAGGGGESDDQFGGGGAGTGGNASASSGGASLAFPSAPFPALGGGPDGSSVAGIGFPGTLSLDVQFVSHDGIYYSGVSGGSGASENPYPNLIGATAMRGSNFAGRGVGGIPDGADGGGAGGFNGDGGDAGNPAGDAPANSGAGGGATTTTAVDGGDGGSGGVLVEWLT